MVNGLGLLPKTGDLTANYADQADDFEGTGILSATGRIRRGEPMGDVQSPERMATHKGTGTARRAVPVIRFALLFPNFEF
jgi:hypothetical protein